MKNKFNSCTLIVFNTYESNKIYGVYSVFLVVQWAFRRLFFEL